MTIHPLLPVLLLALTPTPTPGVPVAGATLGAQTPATDTLRLASLQERARRADPRAGQFELLARQSALRLHNLDAERRPAVTVESHAQYQSDVARIPIVLPGGVSPPTPPNDTYDARIGATQRLIDPTLGARRDIERAQHAHAESAVRVALFALRHQVNDAYFAALRAQAQGDEIAAGIAALEAQLSVATARVREGAALPSEEHTIRAELLRRRQARAELSASRVAALTVLAELTGASVSTEVVLALPDHADDVARARGGPSDPRARPEFERFARSRDVLEGQERARSAQDRPRVSAFGRVGYGRPGLNPLNDTFDSYWLAGVQLEWSPWTWGAGGREREVLALQRRVLTADEDAFARQLHRGVAQDLAAIDRLEASLAMDDEIIALRERIADETRARFAEGVVTSADYVDRQTDLLGARVARALHRVELAQAHAQFLTTLGIEVK
ncbi:MAG: TolC family protein [Gemmatimonadaceae bacterium]